MKNLLFIILLFLTTLSFSQSLGVLASDANVRRSPGGKQLKVISKGKQIQILQTKKGWSFIEDLSNGKKGWISSNLIIVDIVFIKQNANVRRSPGGSIIKVISKGNKVQVLQKSDNWRFIKDLSNGKKGWVHSSILEKKIKKPGNKVIVNNNPKDDNLKSIPNCDYLITSPNDGDKNINIDPTIIRWKHSTGSPKGYYFSIATMIEEKMTYIKNKENTLIKNLNIEYKNSYSISNLKPNTKYFIGLVPYNNIGLADCDLGLFSFTTGNGVKEKVAESSLQIIEKRLTKMKRKSKWDAFNKFRAGNKIKIKNVNDFLLEVKSYQGVPYKFSGISRSGIDCSGLIWKGLRATGYNGERLSAQSLAQSGQLIANKNSLKPGDLVCFTNTRNESKLVHHIGVYVGNKKFLHSSSSKGVIYSDINDPYFWGDKFIFGVRY
tara:strand:+ start:920 stop:2224 length:1305 start_codon:yes stop_codon:yes gene_type:complete